MFDFPSLSRRSVLNRICLGFGGMALNGLLGELASANDSHGSIAFPHFPPRAKRIIFLFMHGGPSHIDLFDPKPKLADFDGQPLPFPGSRVTFADRGNLMKSPWRFQEDCKENSAARRDPPEHR